MQFAQGAGRAHSQGAVSVAATTMLLQEDPSDAGHNEFDRRNQVEHASPSHALAFAILNDALRELTTTSPNRRKYQLFQETLAWFESPAVEHPFYFLPICDYLGIDAKHLRAGAFAAVQRNQHVNLRSHVIKLIEIGV